MTSWVLEVCCLLRTLRSRKALWRQRQILCIPAFFDDVCSGSELKACPGQEVHEWSLIDKIKPGELGLKKRAYVVVGLGFTERLVIAFFEDSGFEGDDEVEDDEVDEVDEEDVDEEDEDDDDDDDVDEDEEDESESDSLSYGTGNGLTTRF